MSFEAGPIYSTLPNAQRGVPLVINGDPKGKNFLYTCGKSVIIRDIANPGTVDVYTQHSFPVTVAKYSPTGFYIASGDQSGKIRIWDTTQKEHILKNEFQPIAGNIKDISWDPESKRIAICGEGREKFGHVFMWDAGSSVGEITGHSKFINSIDIKPCRPYRIVTAGEDNAICWFEGPPFRYKKVIREHSRFVNTIRFSPNGEKACSGGADGVAVLIDGRTGEVVGKLGKDGKAHSGGIYSVSWSPDSSRVLTASGDKTCKVYDVETSQVVTEFKMGNAIEDQQVSCLWQGEYMLSVSMSGNINYLDKNNPDKPIRVLKGHNKNITAVECSKDGSTLYTGCYMGRVAHWKVDGNDQDVVAGKPHSNEIKRIQAVGEKVYTLGFDKMLRNFSSSNEFSPECLILDGVDPADFHVDEDDNVVLLTNTSIVVAKGSNKVSSIEVGYSPVTVDRHPSKPEYAIGGKDNAVHIFTLNGRDLVEKTVLKFTEEVSCVRFSPSGDYLAVACGRRVILHSSKEYKETHTFLIHLSRVLGIAWSPDSSKIASGSIDTNIAVYTVDDKQSFMRKGAHPLASVSAVQWISKTRFVTGGHDACVRTWEFKN